MFGGFEDERTREVTEENVGLEVNTERPYDAQYGVTIPVPETEFTFEQAVYALATSLLIPTPTGSDPYTWSFPIPVDGSARTTNFLAWEVGNVKTPADVHLIPLSYWSEVKFSGRRGQSWRIAGSVMGNRAVQVGNESFTGFTTGLSLPAVTPALFSDARFFIDDSGGSIGTTQVEDVLLGAEITIDSGIRWLPPGDGYRYPRIVKRGSPQLTFSLTYELEEESGASVVAQERAAYDDPTHVRLIRLQTPGPNGASFVIDMAAKYDKPGAYSQEDELDTAVSFDGHATYSPTDNLFFHRRVK